MNRKGNRKGNHSRSITAVLLAAAAVLLTACGSARSGSTSRSSYMAAGGGTKAEMAPAGADMFSGAAETTAASSDFNSQSGETGTENTGETGAAQEGDEESYARKLIVTKNFDVETKEFDSLLVTIESKAASLGGYIEYSSIGGNGTSVPVKPVEDTDDLYYEKKEYYYNDTTGRTANYVIRIPADKLSSFTDAVKSVCNVVSESMSTEDITLQYVDTDARRIALETEQKRLIEMMDQAETVDEMIQVENALTDVNSELQKIQSQLKVYDNQVAYSTVNISITETAEYTEQTTGLSWGERIAKGFQNGSSEFVRNFQNLVIAIASNFLMVIYWLVIIILILILIRFLISIIRMIFRRGKGNRPPENGKAAKKPKERRGFFGRKKRAGHAAEPSDKKAPQTPENPVEPQGEAEIPGAPAEPSETKDGNGPEGG